MGLRGRASSRPATGATPRRPAAWPLTSRASSLETPGRLEGSGPREWAPDQPERTESGDQGSGPNPGHGHGEHHPMTDVLP